MICGAGLYDQDKRIKDSNEVERKDGIIMRIRGVNTVRHSGSVSGRIRSQKRVGVETGGDNESSRTTCKEACKRY